MNDDLLRKLSAPYRTTDDSRGDDLTDRIGFTLREQLKLSKALHRALDPVQKGFRALGKVDFRRRVLVSDTTYAASLSIGTNLFDAALHLHEIEASVAIAKRTWSTRLQPRHGAAFSITPPHAPIDDVWDHMIELHLAGFFRAAASALDCLGIATIGILGLPTPLLTGGWRVAMKAGDRCIAHAAAPGGRTQRRALVFAQRETRASPLGVR